MTADNTTADVSTRAGAESVPDRDVTAVAARAAVSAHDTPQDRVQNRALAQAACAGDMFLADLASDIHLIDLEGQHDGLTINGKNVLAFEPTLSYPVVLQVDQPTYADQVGLGTLIGRSTGEAFTMSFSGQGFVVVQPSEEVPGSFVSGTGGGQQAGSAGSAAAGILGNFLGR